MPGVAFLECGSAQDNIKLLFTHHPLPSVEKTPGAPPLKCPSEVSSAVISTRVATQWEGQRQPQVWLYLLPQSHHPKPLPKPPMLSQNKPSVLTILTELCDKPLFLGWIAAPKSLQYRNPLAKILQEHFSQYPKLHTERSLRVLTKMQMARPSNSH